MSATVALDPTVAAVPLASSGILDHDLSDCERLAVALGSKPFHGRNLFKWLHKHGERDFAAMTDLPRALRERLQAEYRFDPPRLAQTLPSADGTRKWLFELADGQRIETVYIPDNGRHTLCVSSQVGCALDCRFCATARAGFNRNLSVGEIVGQVWLATHAFACKPTNVVLMGMGEPLANFEAVVKALGILRNDLAYMLAKTRVTLSTAGIVPNIYRLRTLSDVSLAVSLHAPDNALRDQLVPLNRKYPLEQLLPACKAYVAEETRRRVTWEYVMLDGVNDSDRHAKALIRLLEGIPSKVNLIPFNPFPHSDFATSPAERIDAFRQRLLRSGLFATVRKTRGEAIAAACGQLVGLVDDRRRERALAPRSSPVVVPILGVAP